MRPISILFNAYLPEHYKIETGSRRKVFVRFGKYCLVEMLPVYFEPN